MRFRASAAVLLAWSFAITAGCQRPPTDGQVAVVARLLEEDPSEPVRPTDFAAEEVLVALEAGQIPLPAGWAIEPDSSRGRPPAASNRALSWIPHRAAAEISAIEVEAERLAAGTLRLEWAGPGEPMAPERSIVLRRRDARGAAGDVYRFETYGHAHWRGELERVRVGVEGDTRSRIERVRVLTVRADRERLAAAAERGWKGSLGDEWRSALLAVPGKPHRWRLEVPEEARLHFSWARGAEGAPLELRVWLDDEETRDLLFSRAIGREISEHWEEAEISLREHAGRRVELAFEAQGAGEGDWAFWGAPVVLGRAARSQPRPPVILISIDTLRADRLSLYGYERPTSPNIDRWARQRAVTFDRTVAPSPWTLPSHASLFTGLEAFRHGANFGGATSRLRPDLTTMAERFRRAGYRTAAITGGGFLHPSYGFDRGFESYRFWRGDLPPEEELEAGLRLVGQYVRQSSETPFFLFFQTYEVHSPYIPRQPHFSRFSSLDPSARLSGTSGDPRRENGFIGEPMVLVDDGSGPRRPEGALSSLPGDLYDSAVAFMDERLGGLFEELEATGVMDRAVIVVTSDHGEALGEEDRWSHVHLWESNVHIPLVISFPGGRFAGRRVERQVRLIDVLPTLLDTTGLAVPRGLDGVSLLPLVDGRTATHPSTALTYAASSNRGLALSLDGRLKYVIQDSVWPPARGRELLYDLARDPLEVEDLSAVEGTRSLARLRGAAKRALAGGYQGLHIRFANASPEAAVQGVLNVPWITPVATKSVDIPCDCVQWRGPGRMAFEIPAETSYTVAVLRNDGDGVGVSGAFEVPGCPEPIPFDLELTIVEMVTPQGIEIDLRTCSWRRGSGAEIDTGLVLWWRGSTGGPSRHEPGDPLLEDQLRALGYVD
jgi:arylsulfatase A-like enzyme